MQVRVSVPLHPSLPTPSILFPYNTHPQAPLQEVLPKIPPTLVQFFRYFDDVLLHRHFPNRFPLVLDKVRAWMGRRDPFTFTCVSFVH